MLTSLRTEFKMCLGRMCVQRDEHRHVVEVAACLSQHADVGRNAFVVVLAISASTQKCSGKFR